MQQDCFPRFSNGDESLKDEEGCGCFTIDDNQLKVISEADPRKITEEVAEELIISHSTVVQYLQNIGK